MTSGLTTHLIANAGRGKRFLLTNEDGHELGRVKNHGWTNLWNQFLGWAVAMPSHDELTVEGMTLTVESKTHLLSGKYRLEINHQPVALVVTHNFQNGYLINVKNERYQLKAGLGNASFQIIRSADQTPVVSMRQQIDDPDAFSVTVNESFGLLTGIGLAMIIMREQGK